MNTSITASKLIDQAILLKEGGAISIPCSSYNEMERLRIRLYKLRKQLEGKHRDMALSLDITRRVGTSSWVVYIVKDKSFSEVLIIEDGEITPFDIGAELPKEAELSEEVTETEDFDDIAAKMEAAQGLTKEVELPKEIK